MPGSANPNVIARRRAFAESCADTLAELAKQPGSLFGSGTKGSIERLEGLEEKNKAILADARHAIASLSKACSEALGAVNALDAATAAAHSARFDLDEYGLAHLARTKAVLNDLMAKAKAELEEKRKFAARTAIASDTNRASIDMLKAVVQIAETVGRFKDTEADRLVVGFRVLSRQIREFAALREKSRAQTCNYLDVYGSKNVEAVTNGVNPADQRTQRTAVDADYENLAEIVKELRVLI